MKSFIVTLLVAATSIGGAVVVLEQTHIIAEKPTFYWEIIAFLAITTAFLFRLVFRATAGHFVQAYLLSMVVKLLGYGAFLFFVILHDRPNAVPNAVLFLIGYLLFTGIEIFYLHQKTRG